MGIITLDEVVTNLTMYTIGVRRMGELPDSDGVWSCDGDMGRVDEHVSTNVVGIVEDVQAAPLQVSSGITGNRVMHQWPMGKCKQSSKKTCTILVVKRVWYNGTYYPRWYIKR